jgi:protein-tyrosine phosphatase
MFKNILFVCTGNICRSALAEYLLKNELKNKSDNLTIGSAGTGALIGYPADDNVKTLLDEKSINCSSHSARQINPAIISNSDLILVMEDFHAYNIKRISPESRGKIFLLGHWQKQQISDPYRKDLDTFRHTMEKITEGLSSWKKKLLA